MGRLVTEADQLVEHILEEDRKVIETLLQTEEFFVLHNGSNEKMKQAAEHARSIYLHFKDEPWEEFTYDDLNRHADFIKALSLREVKVGSKNEKPERSLALFKRAMKELAALYGANQTYVLPHRHSLNPGPRHTPGKLGVPLTNPKVANYFNLSATQWDYPTEQPFRVPNRKGMVVKKGGGRQ